MKIKQRWYAGLKTAEEQEVRKRFVIEQEPAWRELRALLEKDIVDLNTARLSLKQLDNPNWMVAQADYNARERALRSLIDLLTIEEE